MIPTTNSLLGLGKELLMGFDIGIKGFETLTGHVEDVKSWESNVDVGS